MPHTRAHAQTLPRILWCAGGALVISALGQNRQRQHDTQTSPSIFGFAHVGLRPESKLMMGRWLQIPQETYSTNDVMLGCLLVGTPLLEGGQGA
eukprot:11471967-Alexandrium_andersonii.AAC.1